MSGQPQRPQLRGYPRAIHSRNRAQHQQGAHSEPVDTSENRFGFLDVPQQDSNHLSRSSLDSSISYTEFSIWPDPNDEGGASSDDIQNTKLPAIDLPIDNLGQEYHSIAAGAGHDSLTPSSTFELDQRLQWTLPPPPNVPQHSQRRPRSGPKRIVPKGARAHKDLCIARKRLMYETLEDAGRIVQGRTALQLIGVDDVDTIESQAGRYVQQMLEAFDVDERLNPPSAEKRNEAEITYFRQWQTESHNAVVSKLRDELPLNAAFAEVRVWAVMCAVVDMHHLGAPRIEEDNISFRSNLTLKCSERVEQIRLALQQYTIVRLDVLRRARIDQLVADPDGFVRRKLTNVFVNQKKQAKNAAATKLTTDRHKKRRLDD